METPAGKSGLGINDWTTAAIQFPMETLKLTCTAIVWVGRDLQEHLVPTCPPALAEMPQHNFSLVLWF